MDHPSRDEMEARIATVEARVSGRAATFQATVDGYIARMDEREIEDRQRFNRIEAMVADMQEQIRSLKTTIIVTAISTGIAVVLGIGAINATLSSNMLAAFEQGAGVSAAQADMRHQVEKTAALVERMEKLVAQQEQEKK
jgi:hypothetical protein